jgi:DNA polymerase
MGHRAFVDTCKRMAGVEIDLSFSKKVIKTYREANDKIKDLWGQTGTAAIKAIETRETQKVGRLVFTFDGDWLRIKIPSGRCLHYRSPKIIEVRAPWSEGYTGTIYGPSSLAKEIEAKGIELGSDHIVKGDKQGWVECDVPKAARSWLRSKGIECRLQMKEPQYIKQITFWGVDSQTKKWSRQRTYGAKLVENLCQGIARDFLAEAMFRCENAGYPIVATIHDEILCERPIGEGSLDEFETLMKAIPSWGKGCPIEVEGFEAGRYRK